MSLFILYHYAIFDLINNYISRFSRWRDVLAPILDFDGHIEILNHMNIEIKIVDRENLRNV